MTSSATAADTSAGDCQRLGIVIAHSSSDQVIGEMAVGSEYLAADGLVRNAGLLAFAEALAGIGAAIAAAGEHAAFTLETRASHFRPSSSLLLHGHSRAQHIGATVMVWQTLLSEPDGPDIAAVTHTLMLPGPSAASAPLPTRAPAPEKDSLPAMAAGQPRRSAAQRTGKGAGAKVDTRREHIAATACNVISRQGFANTTIREIADAAGLHVPTLYQYVSSKDDVLEMVFGWLVDQVRTDIAEATHGCSSTREKLRAAISSLIKRGNLNRWQIGMLNRELKSLSPKARLRVLGEFQALMSQLAALIDEGVASGEFRVVDPLVTANFLDAVVDVWALRQYSIAGFGVDNFEQEVVRFLEAALLRKVAPAARVRK